MPSLLKSWLQEKLQVKLAIDNIVSLRIHKSGFRMSHCETVQHAEIETLALFQRAIYHQTIYQVFVRLAHAIVPGTS